MTAKCPKRRFENPADTKFCGNCAGPRWKSHENGEQKFFGIFVLCNLF